MHVKTMSEHECLQFLATQHLGHIACVQDKRPYIVPIHYAYEASTLYGFSMPGKKTEWLTANPHTCVQVDDLARHDHWHSVLAEGEFRELPDTPPHRNERMHAWSLLQKRDLWWEPGMFKPSTASEASTQPPIFYSIAIDQLSGRQLVVEEAA